MSETEFLTFHLPPPHSPHSVQFLVQGFLCQWMSTSPSGKQDRNLRSLQDTSLTCHTSSIVQMFTTSCHACLPTSLIVSTSPSSPPWCKPIMSVLPAPLTAWYTLPSHLMLTPWPEGSVQNAHVIMSHPHLLPLSTPSMHLSQPPPATLALSLHVLSSFRHFTHAIPSVMPFPPFLITFQAVHPLGSLPCLPDG